MPALKKAKYELFAQELAKGTTVSNAEAASGLKLRKCEHLKGFYVYVLIDPRDDNVFYVGKGMNRRWADHLQEWRAGSVSNSRKFERIGAIVNSGHEIVARCVESALTETKALFIERYLIETIGLANLTNLGRGHETSQVKTRAWARKSLPLLKPYEAWKADLPNQKQLAGISVEFLDNIYRKMALALLEEAFADIE